MSDGNSEYMYLNGRIYNDTQNNILAKYKTTFNSAIIDNCSDYRLSIIRFQVSNSIIPIFIFKDGAYKVCLSYGGNDYSTTLTYVSTGSPVDREVYYFQQFLDSINDAFVASVTALNAANPATLNPATETPYMIFDKTTQRFSLIVNKSFLTNGVDIYFNLKLYSFFESIYAIFYGYNQPNGKDFKFVIENTGNNTWVVDTNYYNLEQEASNVGLWFDIDRIIIISETIPVIGEFTASQQTLNGGLTPTVAVISDFVINIKNTTDYVTQLNYLPTAEYRRITLNSSGPLLKFDYQVKYQTKSGETVNLYIRPETSINIKFLFERIK